MYSLFGNTPEAVGHAMNGMTVLGALSAVMLGGMLARAGLELPVHKSLAIGILAILVYHGVFALAMKVLMS